MERAFHSVERLQGCLIYIVFEDIADETSLWITEVWASKEAHALSLQNETVKGIIAEAMPLIDTSKLSRAEQTPLFGVGLPR
jgi:quinol monooxygenase YgiN